ncbi:hypothetical protein BC829DRAFT_408306, partial [Chytridium lagenaria]
MAEQDLEAAPPASTGIPLDPEISSSSLPIADDRNYMSIGNQTLCMDDNQQLKEVLDLVEKAVKEGAGHAEIAELVNHLESMKCSRNRDLNPTSDQFDQLFSMKVVRAMAKAFGLHWPQMEVVFRDLMVNGDAVIGRPGSGCSTLLRTLANRTTSFKEIRGTLLFAGLTPDEILRRFRGEIIFAEEEDWHFPSLTVRQTLDFALKSRINNITMRHRMIEITLRLYGLVGCQNTVVGNEYIRGVSGGERKRVSLAEASCVGGCMGVFDGCTKGLDSASALDFIRGLRNIADFQGRTVVASCYQASDAMFELFDKVIVLADGHCTYFGPATTAVSYFESLGFHKHPRTTKAEFLTSCVSSTTYTPSDLAPVSTPPPTVHAALNPEVIRDERRSFVRNLMGFKNITGAKRWSDDGNVKSKANLWDVEHKVGVEEAEPVRPGKSKAGMAASSFSVSVPRQLVLLLDREMQILKEIPRLSGAFTRGGAIFFGLLFNSVSSVAELPKIMEGRPILYKHTDSALYRPFTLFLAQKYSFQILVFSSILYFMVGLQASIQKFLFFYLTLIVSSQTFGAVIKAIGNSVATKELANQVSGAILILSVLYNGYMIPQQDMSLGLDGFIFYINPLSYGFRSLMINEFGGLHFDCSTSATSIVPFGPGLYTNPEYQTCTLAGAKAGETSVDGIEYIKTAYNFNPSWMWWNLLVNLGIYVFMMFVNMLIVEVISDVESHRPISAAPPPLTAYKARPADPVTTLTWTNLVYTVPHTKQRGATLQLLDHVSGRKTLGTIEGEIMVGTRLQDDTFLKVTGYCEQMDVHIVYEKALRFAALLRQPKSVPVDEKDAHVEYIIGLLELDKIADALIGDLQSGVGLSMEERKRLTIGPKIIFLDEPTSGLDDHAASNIVRLLRNLARQGHALVVTIHQPSSTLFSSFDRLLLLGRGGKTIYFGDLGPDSNPAEYMLGNCIFLSFFFWKLSSSLPLLHWAGTAKNTSAINWFSLWNESEEYVAERAVIEWIRTSAGKYTSEHSEEIAKADDVLLKDTLSTFEKTNLVNRRMFYNIGRIAFQIVAGLIIGLSFYGASATPSGAQIRMFALFMTSVLGVSQREYATREITSGTYRPFSFAVAMTT